MGQKINPMSNRLPLTKAWRSRWISTRDYRDRLLEDLRIRAFLQERYGRQSALARIELKRTVGGQVHVILHASKPGIIIGRAGAGIMELRGKLETLLGIKPHKSKGADQAPRSRGGKQEGNNLKIDIVEVRQPELSAVLVAENIASQIERRIAYRRAVRQSMERVMQAGAKGVKMVVSGRLGGAEISRREKFTDGSVPLSTFRADIDYAHVEARTAYGTIGIKVWIHRGKLVEEQEPQE